MNDHQLIYDTLHEAFCNLDFDQNPGLRDRMYLAIEAANRLLTETLKNRDWIADSKKRFKVTLNITSLDARSYPHSLASALDSGWDADDSQSYADGIRKLTSLKVGEETTDIDGDVWTRVEDAP
ncbi:hypothetical protein CPT_Moby_252 [Stenotrophomonas phage Moby]|uniref:Uncharacterized protein n=1 Tax=Stenotrophomonas phage Moby TaxID=2601680 RepID=A0A5P8PMJ7_9CAUD|nr:hypothetical protein HWC58_gp146 [Stenotrophomonas phage Moby]QFR57977.1 hypothetical protein CPT_Moby_252 [Stenotrophomonas phage Moby]